MSDQHSWAAVVALKPSAVAKSRLGVLPTPLRQRLAALMALDTLAAVASAGIRLVVVSDAATMPQSLARAGITATVLPEPSPGGLNNALRAGEGFLRSHGVQRVLACVGDLPAVTAESIGTATRLLDSAGRARGFVPDHSGTGTTLLMADGVDLDPLFGGESAAAHADSGAALITDPALASLRADVDAPDDLDPAIRLGVGTHTGSLISNGRLADYAAITVAGPRDADGGYRVISDAGVSSDLAGTVIDPVVRLLRPGQRLHAATDDGVIISAWP
ncbi:2-phospho-L-lactate guanylyltransferase [Microlunatus soli]|uniref:2-phospho-L-lactate guanylyltransferase n=1 Tax=Microlunatus soli TaxID=630515 RepID=A0A1H1ZFK1_9ACTN|nr:2-phospho-L-lactate guanylyltransferase [Microlunatus soli]SDT32494.1 2-phospho-L-lactate guanylyltransferase [Microlunatus soli]